jgi:hypothetical protein
MKWVSAAVAASVVKVSSEPQIVACSITTNFNLETVFTSGDLYEYEPLDNDEYDLLLEYSNGVREDYTFKKKTWFAEPHSPKSDLTMSCILDKIGKTFTLAYGGYKLVLEDLVHEPKPFIP